MARPTTKADLVQAASTQFEKMWSLIDAMSADEQNAPFNFGDTIKQKEAHWARDKNLRDVLVHLYEWHRLLSNWVAANRAGKQMPFIPAPYNWKTYGQMNWEFWENHQQTALKKSIGLVKKSHANVLAMIEEYSSGELFAKAVFTWTGATTLGSYCVSATASHYDWAIKKIKAHRKTHQG